MPLIICVSEKCQKLYPEESGSLHNVNTVLYGTIAKLMGTPFKIIGQLLEKVDVRLPNGTGLSFGKGPITFGGRKELATAAAQTIEYPCPFCGETHSWMDAEAYWQTYNRTDLIAQYLGK